jgi:Asp-tRNA(Asn)/Glu-tRNA(Gln) amidotransferase A subunit family amidase
MLPLTIGSDGGGSTRLPAALSGVVGYHPSVGRIPFVSYRSRLAKNVFTQATIGPMARDVRDVAIAMQAMAGPDGRDFYCKQERAPDYLARLGDGVRGLNLAWTDDFGIGHTYALPVTPRVIATVREAAQGFNTIGAVLTQTEERWEDFYQALKVLNYVTGFGANQSPEAPTAEAMQAAYELRGRNYDGFRRLFERYDLLVSPTVQFTAFTVEDWDAAWTSDFETYPGTFTPTYTADTHIFNWLGFPAISVPVGFVDGLPVGMQIVGPPEREPLILQAAQAFMAAFPRPEHPPIS